MASWECSPYGNKIVIAFAVELSSLTEIDAKIGICATSIPLIF